MIQADHRRFSFFDNSTEHEQTRESGAVYKSPAVFVFIRALDDVYRENKGCCEHATSGVLVWKPIIVTKKFSQECLLKALSREIRSRIAVK